MGASNISGVIKAKDEQELKRKFEDVQDQCRREYGTDPYNGTWSTLSGVEVAADPFPDKKWTKKKALDVEKYLLDKKEWEYALAVKTSKGYLVVGWAAS